MNACKLSWLSLTWSFVLFFVKLTPSNILPEGLHCGGALRARPGLDRQGGDGASHTCQVPCARAIQLPRAGAVQTLKMKPQSCIATMHDPRSMILAIRPGVLWQGWVSISAPPWLPPT